MQPPTVLIIGCGVAGPAVAVLLKRKGFRPVIYEKVREYGDVGGSLTMMPNGYVWRTAFVKVQTSHVETA